MMHKTEYHEARMETAESLNPGNAIGRQAKKLSRKCAPAQGKIRDKDHGLVFPYRTLDLHSTQRCLKKM